MKGLPKPLKTKGITEVALGVEVKLNYAYFRNHILQSQSLHPIIVISNESHMECTITTHYKWKITVTLNNSHSTLLHDLNNPYRKC